MKNRPEFFFNVAGVAELVDARDLKSSGKRIQAFP
jgi:hypothetical protein